MPFAPTYGVLKLDLCKSYFSFYSPRSFPFWHYPKYLSISISLAMEALRLTRLEKNLCAIAKD